MKPATFEDLLRSVREGGAILRGQNNPSRCFAVEAAGVRAIRERTSLSQSEFAHLIGVSVKTLQNWEQGSAASDWASRSLAPDHRAGAQVSGASDSSNVSLDRPLRRA